MGEGIDVGNGLGIGVKADVGMAVALALAALLPTGDGGWEVLLALMREMMPMVKKKPALKPNAMPMTSARQPAGSWRCGGAGGEGHLDDLRGTDILDLYSRK
jgi:hypothetical protein